MFRLLRRMRQWSWSRSVNVAGRIGVYGSTRACMRYREVDSEFGMSSEGMTCMFFSSP